MAEGETVDENKSLELELLLAILELLEEMLEDSLVVLDILLDWPMQVPKIPWQPSPQCARVSPHHPQREQQLPNAESIQVVPIPLPQVPSCEMGRAGLVNRLAMGTKEIELVELVTRRSIERSS
jgi:hypothetical protein